MGKIFKILSIDGGGFRGAYAVHILKRIEEEYSVGWINDFDLIAGTSTGAIIASGLACGKSASEILDIYKEQGKLIFKKRWYARWGIFGSKYQNKQLKTILSDIFEDIKLGDIKTPLILPATDIGNGGVHVFKSMYDPGFVRDEDVYIRDAVLASCSAPTFFNPYYVDKYLLADGGLWANSPALVAAIDAKKRLGANLDNLKIFSVGTGESQKFYSLKKRNKLHGWGFISKWGSGKFIEMLLNLQSQTANNMLGLLLEEDQVLRLNFKSDQKLDLDNPNNYDDLITRADKVFTHNAAKIKEYVEMTGLSGGEKC